MPKLATRFLVLSLMILLALSFSAAVHGEAAIVYIPVAGNSITPALDTANGDLYAVTTRPGGYDPNVTVISTASNSVIGSIPLTNSLSGGPGSAVYDPSNGDIYVPQGSNNVIYVISGTSNTLIGNITGSKFQSLGSSGIVLDPANGDLYAGSGGQLDVISGSTNQIIATLNSYPGSLAANGVFDPTNGYVYWASHEAALGQCCAVSVISGTSIIKSLNLTIDQFANSPTFDPNNGDIYEPSGPSLLVISGATNTLVANITVGSISVGHGAQTPVFDSNNGDLYVPTSSAESVLVISGASNSVIANVTVGDWPTAATFDPATHEIYVGSGTEDLTLFSNTETAIADSSNSVVATLKVNGTVSAGTTAATFDPANGDIYVPGGGAVAVISGTATSTTSSTTSTTRTTSTTTSSTTSTSTPVPEFPAQFLIATLAVSVALTALLFGKSGKKALSPPSQA